MKVRANVESLAERAAPRCAPRPSSASGEESQAIFDRTLLDFARAECSAWPSFHVTPESFLAYVRVRLPAGEPPEEVVSRFCMADLYLACACFHRIAPAIDLFERQHLSVIDVALKRLLVDRDQVAEVKQRVRQRVLVGDTDPVQPPKIAEYEGRGPLRGWLRVIALREAMMMFRRARRELRCEEDAALHAIVVQDDPELRGFKLRYRDEFKLAFDVALALLSDEERMLLRQHFIDGLTIDQLGRLYHVHRATVARRLGRPSASCWRGLVRPSAPASESRLPSSIACCA